MTTTDLRYLATERPPIDGACTRDGLWFLFDHATDLLAHGRRDTEHHAIVADAKAVCRRCPVKDSCLEWALSTRADFGVLGATTPRERHRLRRHP